MKFKGIIFDLDGTLVNSLEDISDAMNTVLTNLNYPTHTYDTYQYFIGSGLRNLVSKALPASNNSEDQIETCFDCMITEYREICTLKTKPYEGIIELLDTLASKNIKLAVFSNKADELTKKIAAEIFPDYFEAAVGLSTEELKKPNPFEAIEISKNWNLKTEEILFVGDSDIDMQTANNANMFAVGVSWGYRTEQELKNSGAKLVINNPSELIEIV
ncbi:Phosphoglycolate phosphatase [Flavobacterium bizetiae]|uniref:phosphoglycolate phosphatase n=1 Tax=Flavobacterium bizetiae TaxID=2704140 RepID=A0A6J4GKG1_9FLAO|nr:HAD family hydrolase [Flavobacterium bizetiae]CAA9198553.1 Phosphoglycolate phosphatase [Flavobacterium bizetiae]CAD5341137.1 Phosphoglycolate phosphatase [Flavobacterium bizetiae]CAD5347182.1 Phosphoglycolate phosphatase [Flavobacterium bizetiae]